MIAESLKRRRFGFDSISVPPSKRRILCDQELNFDRITDRQSLPTIAELPSKKLKLENLKRRFEEEVIEEKHTFGCSQINQDCSRQSKRQRVQQSVTNEEEMHIKSLPQAQSTHVQSPGRKGKRKNKNRKKGDQKQVPLVEKKVHLVDEPVDSNFNEVNYWRPILPDIEGELARFLQEGMEISDSTDRCMSSPSGISSDEEDENAYNSFNFWRDPFPEVDLTAVV